MNFFYRPYRIECRYPFGISRSTHSYYEIIYVFFESGGKIGRGEIAPPVYYGETVSDCVNILDRIPSKLPTFQSAKDFDKYLSQLDPALSSLSAGLSMAFVDLWGIQNNQSVTELYDIISENIRPTSFTISIGTQEELSKKIEEARDYKILKIKLGSQIDRDIIERIRIETDKPIRVDANGGWSLEEARSMCRWLADQNVELVEQPLRSEQLPLMRELKQESPVALIADENCISSKDIPKLVGSFDGINIKLMKCGGSSEAAKMIRCAHEHGLKVMLGCMVESSVGVTAMSQFASQADFLDLDGNLLINNDPYDGVKIKSGIPVLPNKNGLGLTLNSIGKGAGLL